MKVTKFLHTAIPTLPYDETYDFYTRVMGMKLAPRPEIPGMPGAWLGTDGVAGEPQVHIIGCEPTGETHDPIQVHYALQVESLDDAMRELDTEGVPYRLISGLVGNLRQVFLRDPAGNQLELQEARK